MKLYNLLSPLLAERFCRSVSNCRPQLRARLLRNQGVKGLLMMLMLSPTFAMAMAPVFTSTATTTTNEDIFYSYAVAATGGDGTTLAYSVTSMPAWLRFTASTRVLSGTPDNGDVGPHEIVVSVTDGTDTVEQTFTLTVININDAPQPGDDSALVNEDSSINIDVLSNDFDVDSAVLVPSVNIIFIPVNGTATESQASGEINYTPNPDFEGIDSFQYSITDADGAVGTATVTITVNGVNDAPVALDDSVIVLEDTAISIDVLANDSDIDAGDAPQGTQISIMSAPSNGTTNIVAGQVSYLANANYNGADSFQYRVADIAGVQSNIATVTISVTPVNDLPVAVDDFDITLEDNAVEITVLTNDTDVEDGVISSASIEVISSPANGSAVLNPSGTITYTPDADFNGTDAFQYTIKDSQVATSAPGTVQITISAVNDAPVANNDLLTVNEDTSLDIAVLGNDLDVDGNETIDVGSIVMLNQPTNGTLFIDTTNGMVLYTPNADFFGVDTFDYRFKDDTGADSNDANVVINVQSVNDGPRLSDDSVIIDEDNSVLINVLDNDSDVDGDIDLTSTTIVQQPEHGTVFFNAFGQVSYTPDLNYHGNDTFTYTLNDNLGLAAEEPGAPASVLITINSINDAPTADDNELEMFEGNELFITLLGGDVDGDTITYTVIAQPTNGSLTGLGAALTYTPNENYNGPDSFTFSTNDGLLDSTIAQINITVIPVNTRPVAVSRTIVMNEDSTVNIVLTGTDIDSSTLTYALAGGDLAGTLTGSAPDLNYSPSENFNGSERLLFLVNDGELDSVIGSITLEVLPVNDIPTVTSQHLTLAEDGTRSIVLQGHDIDGDILTYIIEQQPEHGQVSGVASNLVYTPQANYFGDDELTFKVFDGTLNSALATVSFTITGNSDVPIANQQAVSGDEDSDLSITLDGVDPDGSDLHYQLVSAPTSGSVTGVPPNVVYRGNPNFNGTDSFWFKVSDGGFDSDAALVTINTRPVNDAPVAQDDVYTLSMTGKQWLDLDVLENDLDFDGDNLVLVSAQANFGSLGINNNQLRYVPDQDFVGDVLIQYLMNDGTEQQDSAVVQLKIIDNVSANAPVITAPDNINLVASGRLTKVKLGAATALDVQGNIIGVSLLSSSENFAPGAHSVQWKATDSLGNSAIISQQVNIFPLVSLSRGQQVSEGDSVKILARLNGRSPAYPLVIPFTLAGDAVIGIDYELSRSEIVFEQGTEVELTLTALNDDISDGNEEIIIELGNTPYKNNQARHTVTIIEHNVAPQLNLLSEQDSEQRFLVEREGGLVTLKANASDTNNADTLTLEWFPASGMSRSNNASEHDFVFSAQDLQPGIYRISAQVSDNASPALSTQSQITIEVVDKLATLGSGDSDGDLQSDVSEGFKDLDGDHIADHLDAISQCNLVPELVAQQQGFLIEGETGGCLRRGSYSFGSVGGAIMLSGAEAASLLPQDPEARNVGGLFDFEVHNINIATSSYHLVMPQRQPLPSDAVYRKYSPNKGWGSFVEDEQNMLWSAPGNMGICPSPKDSAWQQGLHQGYWCVQLMIEDGGANDDDGFVNQSISDPGGISVFNSNNQLPQAIADTAEMPWNSAIEINVLANDTDPDGDALQIVSIEARLGDVETLDGLTLRYQSLENYVGEDLINYSITDNNGGISSATLTINITGNQAPLAVNDTASITSDQTVTVNVVANDTDPDGDLLTLLSATVDSGSVTLVSETELRYTPAADFAGNASVTYEITDPSGATAQAHLLVEVSKAVVVPPPEPPDTPDTPDKESGGGALVYGLWLLGLLVVIRKVRPQGRVLR